MKEISFAVIGCGFMGGVLARIGCELPYAHCTGLADINQDTANKLAKICGGQPYQDYELMLERERPEAVIIATPEFDHLAPVQSAARHGCQIFLEKPLATSMEDGDKINQACKEAGVKLMLGYILRFETSYALIKSAIDEGSIGKFMSAYARRIAGISEARRLKGRVSPVSYIGVHDIDQMLWYHPVPVKSVYARAVRGRVNAELGTYDMAWMMIEFADGAIGVHEVGWCLPEEWAKWDKPASWSGFGDVRYGVNREGWKMPDTRHWPEMHGKLAGAAKLELEHFFDCVMNDKTPLVTGEDGRRSMEVMLAAEKSIQENRVVQLPLN
jgi:predicted dehydrogenase